MQETTQPTIVIEPADALAAAAYRAEAWAGEPFLRAGEDPAQVLAPGTARRRALDEATAELDAGRPRPSPQWRVRFGLMLGLERVLAEPEPRTTAGTALRRHQVDALAGMLTELIAAAQRDEELPGNGNGQAQLEDEELEEEPAAEGDEAEPDEEELEEAVAPAAEREKTSPAKLLGRLRSSGRAAALTRDLAARRALELLAEEAKPIPIEQARARDKLWTPEREGSGGAGAGQLWTPGSW
jgi:hypothetical protein